ncbi:hypothetical protein NM208_g1375 [Fusarium decemcellulare]|uniref:Uncharacterized protein n=2 Tax=Fusarium decemcellulare TaxID=57161 RepID=A0ACC1SSJ0_9HYPO|nr:hypothetical protein NM208_g2471 [Fusarium decemcellulare]KAJ3547690.1 hypothetical protein NM208_g1375 [Fusarium decemcellulare]
MELAGVVLAAVSAAPVLVDYGQRIYRRVQDRKRLSPLAKELGVFGLDDRRGQFVVLIGLAQSVLKSRIIEPQHKERLVRTWERMKELLIRLDELMDQLTTDVSIRTTFARRETRNELINIGNSGILTQLRNEFRDDVMMLREQLKDPSPLYLSHRDLTIIDDVGDSPIRLVRGRLTTSRDILWFMVESKPYALQTKEESRESIEILARKLSQVQPDTGILPFLGYRDEVGDEGGAFQLIFHGPPNMVPPPTLATHMANRPKPSLNVRVDFCYQLASAVLQTQLLGLVHKNIRPENILVHPFNAIRSPIAKPGEDVSALTLCGWQYAREVEEGVTRLTGDVTLQRRIYQHPERQLPTAEREYSMSHDVYSLGVCMLEMLCWESVLQPSPPFVSQAFVDTFNNLRFQPNDRDPGDYYTKFPNKNKAVLLSMCDEFIPCEAGTKMARIVRDFLTCLDGNGHQDSDSDLSQYVFSNEADRIRVAMNFVDTALKDLRNIQACI